ncbi:MLO-like protein 1 isoform X2 [Selaginella moellendorffii]|uniref:MLO-like protein 1 isoform X2 n=1 Tax=Selaginella moellendorffii TaxID=88036 RepID=UPI000D1C49D7|nr:MLO-like protein 1 isoform X2 [Selaginella moellendorffii]|eukprot:XP_024531892.1 MLO-like protein 1 isoform X2 [Selaginella moellendorffii]
MQALRIQDAPTWAIAAVCSVIVLLALAIKNVVHFTTMWFKRRKWIQVDAALQGLKEELMLLGSISLLLGAFQLLGELFCVSSTLGVSARITPCRESYRRHSRSKNTCERNGKVTLIESEDIHYLHILIFLLGALHLSCCCLTLLLSRAKMWSWWKWEKELSKCSDDTSETSPPASLSHLCFSTMTAVTVCCFQQLGISVTKSDYQAIRQAFIRKHGLIPQFNFHKYLCMVLGDDFRTVIGISAYFWICVILFLLLNINGWHTFVWMAFIPLGLLLIMGTKLQLELRNAKFNEEMQPKSQSFLYVFHFIIFQNSFGLTLFFWIWLEFGIDSCLLDNKIAVIVHVVIGIFVQVLCSYNTLPLYTLVSQLQGLTLADV